MLKSLAECLFPVCVSCWAHSEAWSAPLTHTNTKLVACVAASFIVIVRLKAPQSSSDSLSSKERWGGGRREDEGEAQTGVWPLSAGCRAAGVWEVLVDGWRQGGAAVAMVMTWNVDVAPGCGLLAATPSQTGGFWAQTCPALSDTDSCTPSVICHEQECTRIPGGKPVRRSGTSQGG